MRATASRRTASHLVRRATILTVSLAIIGGLAALPTAPAGATAPVKPAAFALPVNVSALTSGEVEEVLSGIPVGDLNAGQLGEVIAALPGLKSFPQAKLKEAITEAITTLSGKDDTLGQLLAGTGLLATLEADLLKLLSGPELLALLKGESLETVLTGALGSSTSTQLLGELINKSAKPEVEISQLLGGVSPAALEGLLGGKLSGTWVQTTVGGLATELGLTLQQLAEDLKTTTSALPSTAIALTDELTDGKTIGILDGLGGLTLTLLNPAKEVVPGPGSGSNSSTGVTFVTNTSTNTPVLSTNPAGKKALAFKVLSHKRKGDEETVVFQVPGAGTVKYAWNGIRTRSVRVKKAGRLTVHSIIGKLAETAQRRHHAHMKVELRASFHSTGGKTEAAKASLVL